MNRDRRVCVGMIASAHGVKGALKIRSFTEDPHHIFDYAGLCYETGEAVKLRYIGQSGDALLAQMDGVDDRNAAELLKGKKLFVSRDALPETGEGEFYIEDMVGLKVRIADGREVGTVRQVANYGAGDIVEITFNNGTEDMFSFTDATFPEVNIEQGYLILNAPEVVEAKKD